MRGQKKEIIFRHESGQQLGIDTLSRVSERLTTDNTDVTDS
jgi:hypothetical protein